jgi:hypothetical protein
VKQDVSILHGGIMAKVSERERIAALEAKLKQLKVQQQRKEAKARAVEGRRTRREEMRRKFLVGAVILAKVEAGEIEESTLKQWLHPAVTKPEDRALFELDIGV